MRLLPKRALVALGLTIASVGAMLGVGVTAAHASTIHFGSGPFTYTVAGVGSVRADFFLDTGTGNILEDIQTTNSMSDSNHCVEGWADPYLVRHRPANPATACRGGTYDTGLLQIDWPRSDAFWPNSPIKNLDFSDTTKVKLALCQVDTRSGSSHFVRNDTVCSDSYSGGQVGAIHNGSYNGFSWQNMQNVPYPCNAGTVPTSCAVDMRPEYTNRGWIDLAAPGETLYNGDMLVSFDGAHRLVQQASDGNLVLYNAGGNPTWAVASCLTTGHSIATGDFTVLYGSDSNLIMWNGGPQWASAYSAYTKSPCSVGGTSTAGTQYVIMQNDGNFVIYPAAGQPALWSTGTAGL